MDLIPAPLSLESPARPGVFRLDAATTLDGGPGTEGVRRRLRAELGAATGYELLPATGGGAATAVELELADGLEPEGYRLEVTADRVRITGGAAAGLFWGAQTLRQLLGPEAHRRAPLRCDGWTVPCLTVADRPRFGWRGVLLDVARHFLPKADVLRYLDLLAAHKLNVLHLHLTDDQGWRIEVRRYPRLTGAGAWRERSMVGYRGGVPDGLLPEGVAGTPRDGRRRDDRPHGGFYTQDDLREIVAYAAERQITVVPEIDVPGHAQAAIAAYPELGNHDVVDTAALATWTDWGINHNVLNVEDGTLRFYEHVLEEVLEIFPSTFIHLGGDECPKEQWKASASAQARIEELGLANEDELQSWFIRHFDAWLAARGRRLIGWDEILDGGLAPGAAVSSWRGYRAGITAARAGHDVVMCPEQQVYLDHRQAPGEDEPVPVGWVRSLEDVYRFEPLPPELRTDPDAAAHVIGTQANLWTEFMDDARDVDYHAFPRLAAFAEVAWSQLPQQSAERDYAGFEARLRGHLARLDALGVEYRPQSGPHPWQRRPGVPGRPIEGLPPLV
ncbi:beta-N-acetylhexosaminidase [Streptacidiphilus sp. PB12-B1b]|uniref:beta-N-acetylhexosaminidase n=1 Tax=Streptacidiphilus sp. PB12-B1b TaxID=2705012 RepID=UPI0015FC1491|nr:beta-N-acetylhexosaminidase [Streptacidiphilus sp. PB12-B1b]QMU75345.1 beta-N-acetylhexosaminidase [Streptacidiphilus sp. PB12-B1b]